MSIDDGFSNNFVTDADGNIVGAISANKKFLSLDAAVQLANYTGLAPSQVLFDLGVAKELRKLKPWFRAVAQAQFQPARVNWAGDSTVDGYWADNVTLNPSLAIKNQMSAAGQFRTLCANYYGARGDFLPYGGDGVTAAGGSPLNLGFGLGSFGFALNASGTVTTVFPGATNAAVFTWNHSGSPTVNGAGTYNVNAAGAIATPNPGGLNAYNKVSFTAGLNAGSSNSVVWTTAAGAYQGYWGLEYHSGKGVIVGKFGRGGNTLSDFLGHGKLFAFASDRWPYILDGFAANSPDLTIVQFNINEAGLFSDPAAKCSTAEYEADLRQLCTRLTVTATGSVLLIADNQTSSYGNGIQAQYEAVMRKVADDFANVAAIKFSDIIGTYAQANAAGMMGDSTHVNRMPYGMLARWLFDNLVVNQPGY